jgi:serine O-acetyltransferase
MKTNINSKIAMLCNSHLHHYCEKKYWKRRNSVINKSGGILSRLIQLYYLYYIKKCDAFNNASMGTDLGQGANFNLHLICRTG